MDIPTAPVLAWRLGVSLPTVHRILDSEGVPRTGRGIPRHIPRRIADRLLRSRTSRLGLAQTRVLAALRRHYGGIESARKVASIAAVSPTTAAKALRRLVATGLVRRQDVRVISGGRVADRSAYRLNTAHEDWPSIRSAVDAVDLPQPKPTRSNTVPRQFWHMFWNAEPMELRVDEHGAFIARRLLNGADLSAAVWALDNVPQVHLREAISGRGVDDRTRTFVLNYTV